MNDERRKSGKTCGVNLIFGSPVKPPNFSGATLRLPQHPRGLINMPAPTELRKSRHAPREDDDDVSFVHVEKRTRRQLHARPLPRGVTFGPPQVIAELTNAKPSGRGWCGHCPCHDDEHPSLSIGWGRKRNTVVRCHAGCAQGDLVAHFRKIGLSLDPIAPVRPVGDPYAMQRALRLCSTTEWRIYDALKTRGDGPATYEQLTPYAGNNRRTVARALRGLEFLGLLRIERGRPYWSRLESGWEGERRINPANIYAVASERLFRALDEDDAVVLDDLRVARNSEAEAAALYAQPKNGSGNFDTVSYVNSGGGCGDADPPSVRGGGHGDEGGPSNPERPAPSGPKHGKPARAVRAFAAACAALAVGGRWSGDADALLMSIRRPAGEKSWPRKPRTLNDWLWMSRDDRAALGCILEKEWPDAATARRPTCVFVLTMQDRAGIAAEERG
jgi:hypothetical protein